MAVGGDGYIKCKKTYKTNNIKTTNKDTLKYDNNKEIIIIK